MKIREIVGALEQFAPLSLQDSYDNAGLQIGLTVDAESSGVLLCLDITEDVLDEASSLGCDLVISHHPLLFSSPKRITGADIVERCIIKSIRQGINIYSAHTNLDNANGGVNYKIASTLGLLDVEPLRCDSENPGVGSGIIGNLPESMEREDFIVMVKERFDAGSVRYNSWHGEKIRRVSVCGGSGAFLIGDAISRGSDVFLTGEIGYHRFFGYEDKIQLMEIGHYESEQYTMQLLEEVLSSRCPGVKFYRTQVETNPINYL